MLKHLDWGKARKPTSVFAHDSSSDVVRGAAPRVDGLWVTAVHGAGLLIETVVPVNSAKAEDSGFRSNVNILVRPSPVGGWKGLVLPVLQLICFQVSR